MAAVVDNTTFNKMNVSTSRGFLDELQLSAVPTGRAAMAAAGSLPRFLDTPSSGGTSDTDEDLRSRGGGSGDDDFAAPEQSHRPHVEKIIFVDPRTRNIIERTEHVCVVSDDTVIDRGVNLVVAKKTVTLTLPIIQSSRGIRENVYDANAVEVSSVNPLVSHILRVSAPNVFSNGATTKRIRPGTTKKLYGINNVWYDTKI